MVEKRHPVFSFSFGYKEHGGNKKLKMALQCIHWLVLSAQGLEPYQCYKFLDVPFCVNQIRKN